MQHSLCRNNLANEAVAPWTHSSKHRPRADRENCFAGGFEEERLQHMALELSQVLRKNWPKQISHEKYIVSDLNLIKCGAFLTKILKIHESNK